MRIWAASVASIAAIAAVAGLCVAPAVAQTKAAPKVAEETPYPSEPTAGFAWARGWIVRIADGEVVVDLGTADGLRAGQEIGLYRTVKAKHPRTGKEISDRFAIGITPIVEVATHLAILKPAKELLALLAEGDLVECQVPAAAKPEAAAKDKPKEAAKAAKDKTAKETDAAKDGKAADCPPPQTCPPCPPPVISHGKLEPDEEALEESFRNSLGTTPAERVILWRDWLRRFPTSRHAEAVMREVASMQEQQAGGRTAKEDAGKLAKMRAQAQHIFHDEPSDLRVREPAWLAFAAADWSNVADLRIHVRRAGDKTYKLFRPELSGKLHQRLRVPDEYARAPGFEYFAELALNDRPLAADLVGNPRQPVQVKVTDPYAEVGKMPADASTFRIGGDFVDFNRFRRDDQFVYGEVSLNYRLQDPEVLYGIEMGYGLLSGGGGVVATESDTGTASNPALHPNGPNAGQPIKKDDTIKLRNAAFKYGYLGTEWKVSEQFHFITRLVVGLGPSGLDNGLELIGRIGQERGTNLRLGVATMADTGRALSVALTTHAIEQVPFTGIFEVTNRPVGEDVGVRLVGQADYKLTRTFGLTGRLGYNVRTIVHAGFSFGGGVVVLW